LVNTKCRELVLHLPHIMKKFFSALSVLLISISSFAQIPTKCFEIESILVDACSNPEGENEMVRFKVGPNPLNVNNLNVVWPNTMNPWLGVCQNATTTSKIAALNASVQGCGRVVAPVSNILPAGAQVILVTSTNLQVLANSFANLNDTIYAIFQCAGNTAGHFANSGTGLRTLIMSFNPPIGCADTVTYDRALLVNINGTTGGNASVQEGSSVNFAWNGTPTYFNNGCVAPIVELLISIGGDSCSNTAKTFSLSSNTNINNVTWNFGDPTSGADNTASTLSASHLFTSNGSYTITATITGSCGTYTKDTTITLVNCTPPCNPTAQISSVGTCLENAINFSASADSAIANVSWNFGDPNSASNTATGITASHLFSAAGSYTITATVTTVCGATTTATYTINIVSCIPPCNPTSQVTAIGICLENAIVFSASSDSAIANVSWNFGDPNSANNTASGTSASHLFSAVGQYTVTATVTASCGSITTATYTINIVSCATPCNPSNTIDVTGNCLEQALNFMALSDSAIASVSWNFGDPNSTSNTASGVSSSHLFSAAGQYTVSATITSACGAMDTLQLNLTIVSCVNPNPICEANLSSSFTCLDFPATFGISADSAILNVNWNFDDPNSNTNTASGITVVHDFSAYGIYNVSAIVELSCGFDTLTKAIQIDTCVVPPSNLCPSLTLPNAFTPNGDGKNDEFKILNPASYQSLQLNVFNRWGELVFSGNSSTSWDGTFKGLSQPIGVYVYTATAVCPDGKKIGVNGSVTLLR